MSRTPIFFSAVFVILENEKGEVLLQKRLNTGYMDGRYDASMSGHVEPNESIYVSAVRELQEELGVEVESRDLKLAMIAQMDADKPYINFVFICKKWQGVPNIMEPEKNGELLWHSKSTLPGKLTPVMALFRERDLEVDNSIVEYVDENRLKILIGE